MLFGCMRVVGMRIGFMARDENGRALGERLLTEEGDAYGDEREVRPARYLIK